MWRSHQVDVRHVVLVEIGCRLRMNHGLVIMVGKVYVGDMDWLGLILYGHVMLSISRMVDIYFCIRECLHLRL